MIVWDNLDEKCCYLCMLVDFYQLIQIVLLIIYKVLMYYEIFEVFDEGQVVDVMEEIVLKKIKNCFFFCKYYFVLMICINKQFVFFLSKVF